MESCEEHEKGLMRTRSSRPQPRILQPSRPENGRLHAEACCQTRANRCLQTAVTSGSVLQLPSPLALRGPLPARLYFPFTLPVFLRFGPPESRLFLKDAAAL